MTMMAVTAVPKAVIYVRTTAITTPSTTRIQQNSVQSPTATAARHTTTLNRWPDDPVICMVSLPMCHPSPFRRQHNCHLHSTNSSPSTAPRFLNVHQQYVYLINIKSTIFILLCAREVPTRFIVCFLFCFLCQKKLKKKIFMTIETGQGYQIIRLCVLIK